MPTRLCRAAALTAALILTSTAYGEVIKPIKSSRAEIAGAIFSKPGVSVEHGPDGTSSTDAPVHTSADGAFQTGMYKSGPFREEIAASPGFPYEEFLYFVSGGVRLTSSDGSSMTVRAGESVTIPKGWSGVFETKGYTKIYVIYDAAAASRK
ncbi:cupin domain-containing protein [Cupriavidus agavae]|uniref:Putative cupin superfamily protein n=1 Tax=Cupriavidus agavae TaxID=1001822 RepID=A0A4Q7R8V2_9BURK|nr:cupin domain-containing protein [Cupriavidus agavae]RZT29266.1 putative cupin superfamily protein [Cupriavidus agavae]